MISDWIQSIFIIDGINDADNVGATQLVFKLSVTLFNSWKLKKNLLKWRLLINFFNQKTAGFMDCTLLFAFDGGCETLQKQQARFESKQVLEW